MSARQTVECFGVGVSTAIVWVRRARVDGERLRAARVSPRATSWTLSATAYGGLVEATTDITLKEMQARLQEETGATACCELWRAHSFELACAQLDIEHRLTKPKHPWTNGKVERMNRTIKDATVERYHYDNHDQLGDISPTSWPPTTSDQGSRPSGA